MSIRKGNYGRNGSTFGKVDSVSSESVSLISPNGKKNVVSRSTTTKISFSEYTDLASTQGPSGPTGEQVVTTAITDEVKAPAEPKPTDKKTVALAVYAELTVEGTLPSRKDFSAAMAKRVGLSAKGSSTYFYNVKNGKWSA